MARIAIIGASIGGLPAAYEARALLEKKHKVTVVSTMEAFHFVCPPTRGSQWVTENEKTSASTYAQCLLPGRRREINHETR